MTENMAARGEGLKGLVAKWEQRIESNFGPTDRLIGINQCLVELKAELALEAAAPASTSTGGFVTGFERVLSERDGLKAALTSGLELVENAFAHVSHGGPTRADAEKWIAVAREALGERI